MGNSFYDDEFAADMAVIRHPAWTEPDEAQVRTLRGQISGLADEMARAISTRVQTLPADAPADAADVVQDAGDWVLSRMRVLREIRDLAEELGDETAIDAGIRGANYPQLGKAWAMSRQGARKRWPDAVSAMSPPPAGEPLRTTITAFGGTADLSWHGSQGGWWWIGQGADGTTGDAGDEDDNTYDTKEEAAARAGAFLQQHGIPTTDGDTK